MSKKPNKLEIRKLFKEFGYLKADEEYKIDFIQAISPEFQMAIKDFLKDKPDLNALFGFPTGPQPTQEPIIIKTPEIEQSGSEIKLIGDQPSQEQEQKEFLTGDTFSQETTEDIAHTPDDPKKKKLKKLYRHIATKTHPDKVKMKFLNDLYLKAKTHYQKNDLFSIYLICNDLDIEYKLEDDEVGQFNEAIKNLRMANHFVESTYLWMWYFEEDENKKMQLLNNFIINNPNHVIPILKR